MPLSLAIILGIVQGVTEFLPVSSSGHLVVLQYYLGSWMGAEPIPLAFDVFIHFATLLVTAFYLRHELKVIFLHFFSRSETGRKVGRLVYLVFLATIPIVIAALLFKDQIEQSFVSLSVAAKGFLITALLLAFAHRRQLRLSLSHASSDELLDWEFPTVAQALIIGAAQALAVLPGVSRSGSTIGAALILGLPVQSAVRFSFFLLLPAVFGATLLEAGSLFALSASEATAYLGGFMTTLIVGWAALLGLVKLVQSAKLSYFAAYTLFLGILLHLT